jgi:insulysin
MRRFGSGNYASLHDAPLTKGKDVRSELLNMHKKLYSANLMKLCIVGSDSLDELESWVRDMFGAVPDLDVPKKRSWAEHRAFGGAGWHTMQVLSPAQ